MVKNQLRSRPRGNTTIVVTLVLVALFLVGAYITLRQPSGDEPAVNTPPVAPAPEANTQTPSPEPTSTTTTPPSASAPAPAPEVKSLTIIGKNFSFSSSEIRVRKGDKVVVTFVNEVGFHDFVLDEFNVRTPKIGSGATAKVEFTADRAGTFEYYCSVGEHRQIGMRGNLIVE